MSADFENEYTEEISEPCPEGRGVNMEDFVAYMPAHFYIFTPCREPWVGASVNSRLPRVPVLDQHRRPKYDKHGKPITISPTSWLDRNRPVEQMTWAPGLPMTIKDRLVADGGWIERQDVTCFNLYRPPRIEPGDAAKAGLWLDHIYKIFDSDDAAHCIHWLAHRVQLPQDKINHALVLGGAQGIGKDTMLEPLKHAVGPWNFHEVSPGQLPIEDHRMIALDVRELIRNRVFDQPVGSIFHLNLRFSLAPCDAAEFFLSRFAACHRSHRGRAAGLGEMWRSWVSGCG